MFLHIHKPESIQQAINLKNELGSDAHYLAGGTELNALDCLSDRPHAILLDGLLSKKIEPLNDNLFIGANCTFQELIEAADLPGIIGQACGLVASRNIRNMATLGGQLGSKSSAGVLSVALLALQAQVVFEDADPVPAAQFLLGDSEYLISGVNISMSSLDSGHGLSHFRRSGNDRPILVSAVSVARNGEITAALGGVSNAPLRLDSLGDDLTDSEISDLISSQVSPESSIQCSVDFKKHLAGELVVQALQHARLNRGAVV